MLRLTTEAVDYSYEMMSRSVLTGYRRANSGIKNTPDRDSQDPQAYYNSALKIFFAI